MAFAELDGAWRIQICLVSYEAIDPGWAALRVFTVVNLTNWEQVQIVFICYPFASTLCFSAPAPNKPFTDGLTLVIDLLTYSFHVCIGEGSKPSPGPPEKEYEWD